MSDFEYRIVEELGVLSTSKKGWNKELNLISWNNGTPKYDIRDWSPDHSKMGKGISLDLEELNKLIRAAENITFVKNFTISELVNSWDILSMKAPNEIKDYLKGSRMNEINQNTVMLTIKKGVGYLALLAEDNRSLLNAFVQQYSKDIQNIEITESVWL